MSTRTKFDVENGAGVAKKKLSSEGAPPWKIGLAVGLFAVAGFLIYWNMRPQPAPQLTQEQQQEVNRLQDGMQADKNIKRSLEVPPDPENTTDTPGSRARKAPGT